MSSTKSTKKTSTTAYETRTLTKLKITLNCDDAGVAQMRDTGVVFEDLKTVIVPSLYPEGHEKQINDLYRKAILAFKEKLDSPTYRSYTPKELAKSPYHYLVPHIPSGVEQIIVVSVEPDFDGEREKLRIFNQVLAALVFKGVMTKANCPSLYYLEQLLYGLILKMNLEQEADEIKTFVHNSDELEEIIDILLDYDPKVNSSKKVEQKQIDAAKTLRKGREAMRALQENPQHPLLDLFLPPTDWSPSSRRKTSGTKTMKSLAEIVAESESQGESVNEGTSSDKLPSRKSSDKHAAKSSKKKPVESDTDEDEEEAPRSPPKSTKAKPAPAKGKSTRARVATPPAESDEESDEEDAPRSPPKKGKSAKPAANPTIPSPAKKKLLELRGRKPVSDSESGSEASEAED